jgi:hypothetical protein
MKSNVLLIILATPPIDTLIQLLDLTLKSDTDLSILVHLSNQYNINETIKEVNFKINSSRINFMSKSYPTSWGKISYALIETMSYAYNNLTFSHLVLLPFNCLPIRKSLNFYIKLNEEYDIYIEPRIKIYKDVIIENNQVVMWNSGKYFQENKISRFLLRKFYNGKYHWGGNFEGVVLKKNVVKHLIKYKFWFKIFQNKLSLLYEEIFFPTILTELSKRYDYKVFQKNICFVDWDKSQWIFNSDLNKFEHKVEFGDEKRILKVLEENEHAFFYKWVSTDINNPDRKDLIKFLSSHHKLK